MKSAKRCGTATCSAISSSCCSCGQSAHSASRSASHPTYSTDVQRSMIMPLVQHVRAALLVAAAIGRCNRLETVPLVEAARPGVLLEGPGPDRPRRCRHRLRQQPRANALVDEAGKQVEVRDPAHAVG